jgi:hypothetical protein
MKKLRIFASIGAALVCAAMPASYNGSSGNVALLSLDRSEARIGKPLTPLSVAGASRRVHRREYRRAIAAGAAFGIAAGAAAGAYVGGPPPAYVPGPPVEPGPTIAGPPVGPPEVPVAGPPTVVVAAPYGGPGYGYGPGPYPDTVIVNPVTGRWCRTEPNGYQWCWTP